MTVKIEDCAAIFHLMTVTAGYKELVKRYNVQKYIDR